MDQNLNLNEFVENKQIYMNDNECVENNQLYIYIYHFILLFEDHIPISIMFYLEFRPKVSLSFIDTGSLKQN